MDLSIIIPIYNEELNINKLYERLNNVLKDMDLKTYEFIFINDGSKDRSLELIKSLSAAHSHVKYINLSRNFGHQIAVTAGLDNSSGDAIAIIDADLQDPPELIPELYKKLRSG